jgi:ankyrin repeat protein
MKFQELKVSADNDFTGKEKGSAREMRPLIYTMLLMLSMGAVCAADEAQTPRALVAAVTLGEVQRVEDLLAQGGDVNGTNQAGRSLLHLAAFNGNTRTVRILLSAGADPDATGPRGSTPLMDAAAFGHLKVVQLLVQRGADLNKADQSGATALALAKRGKHEAVATLLSDLGASETAPASQSGP